MLCVMIVCLIWHVVHSALCTSVFVQCTSILLTLTGTIVCPIWHVVHSAPAVSQCSNVYWYDRLLVVYGVHQCLRFQQCNKVWLICAMVYQHLLHTSSVLCYERVVSSGLVC